MPRVKVIADDGWVALDELATREQLEGDHARAYLAERIAWAVEDAEARARGHALAGTGHEAVPLPA